MKKHRLLAVLDKVIIYVSEESITLFETTSEDGNIISCKSVDLQKIAEIVNFSDATCYIIYCPSKPGQRFFTRDFPFISYININSLLKRTILEEECGHYDLCEYFPSSKTANRLFYSFVCSNVGPEIELFINSAGKKCKGIFFPFLEMGEISKNIFGPFNRLQRENVVLVYSPTRTLTVIRLTKEHIPLEIINIKLEQNTPTRIGGEILQKIEDLSLRKSSNIAVIATKTINQIIKSEEKLADMFLLTPYEAAILLKVEKFFREDEERSELLFATNILLGKTKYRTLPRKHALMERQRSKEKGLSVGSLFMFLLVALIVFFGEIKLHNYANKNNTISKEILHLEKVIGKLRLDLDNYDARSKEKIKLYKVFQSPNKSPVDYLRKLENQVSLKKVRIEYDEENIDPEKRITLYVEGNAYVEIAAITEELKKYYTNHCLTLNGKVVAPQ
ncbi:hypothetical protein ACJZTR_03265 [Neorickettsia risticii]|uniref:Uncharacterized protein n=1 Tax=Neorickettsia risticii (strain Illinois) TaxID=434131 RepID=C6V5Q9_NEORI|nr:hypothetical protein [Neorickettsia risticii]ACT69732.1 conserved hypothetical protein [Neorickettsia risticii str. Illinois]